MKWTRTRQPGGSENSYSIKYQHITTNVSCQVIGFFIGPGGYRLLQCADIQHYQSFITRQVV